MNQILILIPDKLKKPMGGMGEQLRNLAAHTPSNYHLTIIGSANSEEYSEERFDYYAHHDLSTMWSKENHKMVDQVFLKQSLFVQRALSLDIKPDIVHAFDWSTMWAGRIIARHYGVPLITTIQLSIDANTPNHVKATELEYDLAAAIELSGMVESSSIIQVSENYASLFPKFLLQKTTVIHNGIDLKLWEKENDVELVGNGRRKIVYIGRFAKMKNVDALFVGPYDLSASLGDPGNFETIKFRNTIDYILKICKKFVKLIFFTELLKKIKLIINMDFTERQNLFNVRKTVLEMLEDRNYIIPESEKINFDD